MASPRHVLQESVGVRNPALDERLYRFWAALVLVLAAFNLTFRLGHEIVVDWDESLYGISAWEMLCNHQWLATTFRGSIDYYNTKPPLNIWLLALSFKAFGPNLISLRLPSILSAWITVLVLQLYAKRTFGPLVSILSSLVLATSFGFLYDHAGRNANTDALFALLVLLTVVTLWAARDRPWLVLWLAPILAATFLLRGMGVLMPLAIALLVAIHRRANWRERLVPWSAAVTLSLLPIAIWAAIRWRLDQWKFLGPLFTYDFIARTFTVIEGHGGGMFFHLNVLQKNQFDWLIAALLAYLLFPVPWSRMRDLTFFWRRESPRPVVGSWATVTFLLPTLMKTKLSWYLNPFYPVCALVIGALISRPFCLPHVPSTARRRAVVAATVALTLLIAEGRLIWYSVHRRDLANSTQGVLLSNRQMLQGHRVFRNHWSNSELFVLGALVGVDAREAGSVQEFIDLSEPNDYWMDREDIRDPRLRLVLEQRRHWFYRRVD